MPEPKNSCVKRAPDFEANAFVDSGFKNLKLSDFKSK